MTEESKPWPKRPYSQKSCGFGDCGRAHYARGFCNGHYQQWRRGDELKPLPAAPPRRARPPRSPCKFDGCDRRNYGDGLCSTHYMQRRRGYPLGPIRSPRPDPADGMPYCTKCQQYRDEAEFNWNEKWSRPEYVCRPCVSKRQTDYVAKLGSAHFAKKRRLHRYGLTAEQFDELERSQEGRCVICRRERKLDIDHCHTTGAVRGLLCSPCNRGLGFMDDDPAILRAAVEYLERSGRLKTTGG